MSTAQARHVVIIGGGFAGIAAAIKLARATPVPLRISVVEKSRAAHRAEAGAD